MHWWGRQSQWVIASQSDRLTSSKYRKHLYQMDLNSRCPSHTHAMINSSKIIGSSTALLEYSGQTSHLSTSKVKTTEACRIVEDVASADDVESFVDEAKNNI